MGGPQPLQALAAGIPAVRPGRGLAVTAGVSLPAVRPTPQSRAGLRLGLQGGWGGEGASV